MVGGGGRAGSGGREESRDEQMGAIGGRGREREPMGVSRTWDFWGFHSTAFWLKHEYVIVPSGFTVVAIKILVCRAAKPWTKQLSGEAVVACMVSWMQGS